MTIYVTPFDDGTKQCTGPSTDSGFASLDEVAAVMGEPDKRYEAMLIYGAGNERVLFSRAVFCIDGDGNKD